MSSEESKLLAQWQRSRDPQVAARLCALPVPSQMATRFKHIAAARHDRARPRIKSLPDDPRVTAFFLSCLRASKWPAANASGLWALILDRLVALKDTRALAPLEHAISDPPHCLSAKTTALLVEKLRAAHAALDRSTRTLPRPASTNHELEVAQWLARVWAAPWDSELKLVVADALQDLKDPRGELIALQMAPPTPASALRVKAILRKAALHLAGPIARVTTRRFWHFEKGFLTSCEVVATDRMIARRAWEDAARAPEWATVERVRLRLGGPPRWWPDLWAKEAPLWSLREVQVGTASLGRAGPRAPWEVVKSTRRQFDELCLLRDALNGGAAKRSAQR